MPLNFFQIETHMRDPYFQQWNVALQKVVARVISLEGAYVGSKGTKIEFSQPVNVPVPGPAPFRSPALDPLRLRNICRKRRLFELQRAARKAGDCATGAGFSLLSSYAFAKSIDNLSGDNQGFSSQDPNNNNAEKGVSDYDVKHRFVNSLNYALPFGREQSSVAAKVVRGWELGSIVTMQSGLPFTPAIGTDPANTGTELAPRQAWRRQVDDRTLLRDFDASAFEVPASFTFGNSGRNILYGRGFRNWDFIVVRNFAVRETVRLQFRSEFFNFTNTPAFGGPVTTSRRRRSAGFSRPANRAIFNLLSS